MLKIVLLFILVFKLSFANDNVVKTSELELFLFKVGFQGLLEDVDLNKEKVTLNSEELKNLNKKIEFIMDELYKNENLMRSNISENQTSSKSYENEIRKLNEEIVLLREEISSFKAQKEEQNTKAKLEKKEDISGFLIATVKANSNIRAWPSMNGKIVDGIKAHNKIYIQSCDIFGWCKVHDKNQYIAKHLLIF